MGSNMLWHVVNTTKQGWVGRIPLLELDKPRIKVLYGFLGKCYNIIDSKICQMASFDNVVSGKVGQP